MDAKKMERELRAAGFAPMNEKQWRSPKVDVVNSSGDKGKTFTLFETIEAAHAALKRAKV